MADELDVDLDEHVGGHELGLAAARLVGAGSEDEDEENPEPDDVHVLQPGAEVQAVGREGCRSMGRLSSAAHGDLCGLSGYGSEVAGTRATRLARRRA